MPQSHRVDTIRKTPAAAGITVFALCLLIGFLSQCGSGHRTGIGWMTFRSDNTHSGYSSETLSLPLSRQWSFQSSKAPEPAWPEPGEEMQRMQLDNAFHTTVAYETVYFGSSVDHAVHALDARTGKEKWRFYTDAPVRYSPSIADHRIYAGSDDGFVYCLDARSGRPLWKYRAGPGAEKVLGNGHMISLWPVRTNILVDQEIAYFGAGVFPYEGIVVCALDARDGSVIWRNDTVGDHEHELAFGGISPQGYLVASENILYVPSSRAMPAAFDKHSGDFLYYLEPGGKVGGVWTVLDRDHIIAGVDLSGTPAKVAYDEQTGERREDMHAWFPGIDLVVTPDTSYTLTQEGIYALNRHRYLELQQSRVKDLRQKRDSLRGRLRDISSRISAVDQASAARLSREREEISGMINELAEIENLLKPEMFRWETPSDGLNTIILMNQHIFAGGKEKVLAYEAGTGEEAWKAELHGDVKGLSASNGRLLVSTDTGHIYCFGQQAVTPHTQDEPGSEIPPFGEGQSQTPYRTAAADILERTGIIGGYALVLGCDSGRLAYELAKSSELRIIGIAPDAKRVQAIRKRLAPTGLYGHRIMVAEWNPDLLPDYFANLIVSEGLIATGSLDEISTEIFRVLKPHGGMAVFGTPREAPPGLPEIDLTRVSAWFESGIHGAEVVKERTETWLAYTRKGLKGAGVWTEEYGNPGNTACSGDELVKGPLGILWFGDPGSKKMLDRHAKAQSPLSMDGRMFIQGEEVITAYDAYNGVRLWEKDIAGAVRPRVDVDGGNFSMNKDSLYVGAYDHCFRLDPATGTVLGDFLLPDSPTDRSYRWAHVSATASHLFGSRARGPCPENISLFKRRWSRTGNGGIPRRFPSNFWSSTTN